MTGAVKSAIRRPRLGYRINAVGVAGALIVAAWIVVALASPYIVPHPVGDIVDTDYFGPMSRELWLGSDYLGRDMTSRILMGARYTLGISIASVIIAGVSGVTLGMIAAITGGDTFAMRKPDPAHLFGTVERAGGDARRTVMIGDSKEDELDDRVQNFSVNAVMADRAQRTFPHLARLNVVRSWTGIRVMPKDGFPIYEQSDTHPGAFVACCHSGVTLAANHAFEIARMVKDGALEPELVGAFTARRFASDAGAGGSGYY